jgi:hypothetical protein
MTFDLTLRDAARAYAPLIEFSLGFDDADLEVIAPYGTVPSTESLLRFDANTCAKECFADGTHDVRVVARLATGTESWLETRTQVRVDCTPPTTDDAAGCSMKPDPSHPEASYWLACIALAALGRRRLQPLSKP